MQAMQSCSVKPSNVFGGARCQNMPRRCIGNRLMVRAEKVLIINTKGGGHAPLGLHLAKTLLKGGHSITILNDGDKEKTVKKVPFSEYASIEGEGVNIQWGDPTDAGALPDGPFDVVYDNNGKSLDVCQPAIDKYKGQVQHYVYVSSAGAYVPGPYYPELAEGDERKASAGHVEVENYLEEQDVPYTVFQPQYLYGDYCAKDCEQWFIDRIVRDRPVLLPSPGDQLVNISHVADLGDMLSRVPGNEAAKKQHFNLVSGRAISHSGLVEAIAKQLGKTPEIKLFDPKKHASNMKAIGYPFRPGHFYAVADKARALLQWQPSHDFLGDVEEQVRVYKEQGRDQKDIDFSADDELLASL
mmetsp:Transcript_5943/g.17009  ORF Transcript_5943/g.17009 Transcript_5943/m.17009 type:complete len:356 (-) Transcript_5943:1182-2249(-)|eukprot:CAMPEP_0206135836 /NCGR_PEP_ID=MMETSP1473-20131121/1098_1 /ASSEMBLY_ACC=CAM_ASM_001109 /TAXON_ID=1461547 /ORGANISM="Stichococcus sp, Strain RCC1054" /LENGTH=355 /DNA_ID=CAMNT_0053527955 /DNA_START=140 /DNA_END=1207 /DNA_ORIENTATION=-